MTFRHLQEEEFICHSKSCAQVSFMQSPQMAQLLKKRGFQVDYVGYLEQDQILISAILYTSPVAGGLHMEINCGPISTDPAYLPSFYKELQRYAKENGAIELTVKPYETYQTFDSNGTPTGSEQKNFITQLTDLGYQFDGLKTGYPGGEPDWHYVKDLSDVTLDTLLNSFSKKGKPLIKKANTFGIQLKKLTREELPLFKDITSATSERREYSDKSLDYYQDLYDAFGDHAEFMIATLNFQDYFEQLEKEQKKLAQKIETVQAALATQPTSEKKQNQLRELSSQFDTFETRKKEARDLIEQYGQKEQVLAGSLFLYTSHEATYLFSGSYPAFNKFYAPALLQEYVMKQALHRQIPFYNFLGIEGVFDGSDGVLRFKQNFNGFIVRKMGTFHYYPKPFKFKLIHFVKKALGRL